MINFKLTNQDANEGAEGEPVLLHEVDALLLLDYSHDGAWVSRAGVLWLELSEIIRQRL